MGDIPPMEPVFQQITPEIFQIGGAGFTAPEDAAVYAIHIDGRAALVDAGCGASAPKILKNAKACGIKPDRVELLLLTHCHFDHVGGAATLRERTGCRIAAHAMDAPFLERGDNVVTAASWYGGQVTPVSVDIALTGERQTLEVGGRPLEAIHIPGHSPGSLAYLLQSDGKRVLFAQDVHGPLAPSLLSNEADYQRSLRRLRDLDADILCEGHYGVFEGREEARRFIESFIEPGADIAVG
jgi:glyoxylase-like metal-dependent hydrolase (beta-lactamase superfamily II)